MTEHSPTLDDFGDFDDFDRQNLLGKHGLITDFFRHLPAAIIRALIALNGNMVRAPGTWETEADGGYPNPLFF